MLHLTPQSNPRNQGFFYLQFFVRYRIYPEPPPLNILPQGLTSESGVSRDLAYLPRIPLMPHQGLAHLPDLRYFIGRLAKGVCGTLLMRYISTDERI